MHVDSRYNQLSALIDQKRVQQGIAKTPAPVRPAASATTTGPHGAFRFEDAASRARRAMAARNPALAARMEAAAAGRSGSVESTRATRFTSSIEKSSAAGSTAGAGNPAPVTRDLLAVPGRPARAPGLGTTIDTYA